MLAADVRSITSPLDVKTEGRGADDYDPYASGAKVKIYATGIRNGYDLIWTGDGKLYVPANGSAAGGNTPAGPGNSPPAINNVNQTEHDYLFRIDEGGYYGHPNPLRNEYVLNGGNPTSGADPAEFRQYPVGTQPDANYRGYAYDFGLNASPDGAIQYQSNGAHFGGALDGKLVVVRYSGGDDLLVLDPNGPNGDVSRAYAGGFGMTGFVDPLDVIQDPATGNLYVVEAGFRANGGNPNGLRISLLKPVASGATAAVASPRLRDGALHFSDVRGDANAGVPHTVTITNTGTERPGPARRRRLRSPAAARPASASAASARCPASSPPASRPASTSTLPQLTRASSPPRSRSRPTTSPTRRARSRSAASARPARATRTSRACSASSTSTKSPSRPATPTPRRPTTRSRRSSPAATRCCCKPSSKAGGGPVTVELLASMGTAQNNGYTDTSALSYYAAGTSTKTQLFTIPKSQAQTVNPSAAAAASASTRAATSASSAPSTTSAPATSGPRTAETPGSPTPTSGARSASSR